MYLFLHHLLCRASCLNDLNYAVQSFFVDVSETKNHDIYRGIRFMLEFQMQVSRAWVHFTKGLWAYNNNNNNNNNTWSSCMKILIQSSHNFAHVTTAQLLWHVQNRGLIGLENSKLELQNFTRFESWAHKTLSEMVLWWHEATTCANIDLPTNQFLWYSH